MRSPGVSVRPIITIDGVHEVNDVFLDDVRVPLENRIGEENRGWDYAKFLLGHERTSMAGTARSRRRLEQSKLIAANEVSSGCPLIEDDAFARQVARIEIELTALAKGTLGGLARRAVWRSSFPLQDQGYRNPATPNGAGAGSGR